MQQTILLNNTPNANMADRSVGARDESHASEDRQALMFCFDRRVLLRRRSGLFLFRCPYKLLCSWMKELKSSTAEKFFFFRFRGRLTGKTDKKKYVTIAEGTVKTCSFRLKDLRKCVSDRNYLQVVLIWLKAFTGNNDGGCWSSFAWLLHRSICFARPIPCEWTRSQLLPLTQRMYFKRSFSLHWGRYWPCKSCWSTTRQHISSSFIRFF